MRSSWLLGFLFGYLLTFAAIGALFAFAIRNPKPTISIKVSPQIIAIKPSNVVITVRISRDPNNGSLLVYTDDGEFYRRTDIQLDGADAPITHRIEWQMIPPGSRIIWAIVYDRQSHRIMDASTQIIGSPEYQ